MNQASFSIRSIVVILVGCLFFGQTSVIQANGSSGEFDPSAVLPPTAPQTLEPLAFDMNRILTQQTRMIRYEATAYQRKVAAARARAFVEARRKEIARAEAQRKAKPPTRVAKKTPPKKAPPVPEPQPKTASKSKSKPKPKPAPEPEPEPQVVAKVEKLPRYIAVDTVKDERASPKAKKVVMVWDTHADSFVGNNLYDVEKPPPVGSTAKFETYAAEYIGTGM